MKFIYNYKYTTDLSLANEENYDHPFSLNEFKISNKEIENENISSIAVVFKKES